MRNWAQTAELLYFLTAKDIKLRYRQTLLGAAWVLAQPVAYMAIFAFLFTRVMPVKIAETESLPYPVFLFCGLVPWFFFQKGVQSGCGSLVQHANLVRKIPFPRFLLPVSAVTAGLFDFLIAFSGLIIFAAYFRVPITPQIAAVLPAVVSAYLAACGIALWLSAWNVFYRDVQSLVPIALQLGLFATPIIYPLEKIPQSIKLAYSLNPMVGVTESFRAAFSGADIQWSLLLISYAVSVALVIGGYICLRRTEHRFADVI